MRADTCFWDIFSYKRKWVVSDLRTQHIANLFSSTQICSWALLWGARKTDSDFQLDMDVNLQRRFETYRVPEGVNGRGKRKMNIFRVTVKISLLIDVVPRRFEGL